MATIEPSHSFHIARAYQLQSGRPPAAPAAVRPPAVPHAQTERASGINRLIGGIVRGQIDFTGDQPAHIQGALPMYRHPADRNNAATAIHAGRFLDTTA